jgi:putative glutamine amidotransferase
MKPVVGIVARNFVDQSRPWYPVTEGVQRAYVDAIVAAGAVPVLLPILSDPTGLSRIYAQLDGLLLAGGGDVSPTFYHQVPYGELDRVNIAADEAELAIIHWAMADKKPLLGICRGMQLVNVALGGSLHQDLHSQYETRINHQESFIDQDFYKLVHHLILQPESRLAGVLGTSAIPVNTLHHQSLDQVAKQLKVVGRADDGVVEAVEGLEDNHYLVGIQSHPEIMVEQNPVWKSLFADFAAECRAHRGRAVSQMVNQLG